MTRLRLLGAVLLLAALAAAGAAATWFSAPVDAATGTIVVSASGFEASPVLGALVLVLGAGLAALLLVHGALARVVTGVMVLAALSLVVAGVLAWRDPHAALASAAAQATGVAQVSGAVTTTVWPVAFLVVGVLLTLTVAGLLAVPASAARGARYERDARGSHTRADDWDSLSRGQDPTA